MTVRVTEQWNRQFKWVVDSPSVEVFNTCLEAILCNLL